MDLGKLQFFDYKGYNLNFEFNEKLEYWEGTIYLPRVSVGIYSNTTIYILEEKERSGDDIFTKNFVFPTGDRGSDITFTWDRLNKFVDEFFMFNFDESYVLKETSALVYTPNDGPEGNTLIINRFDKYEIPLDNELTPKALPVHIAFMASEKYDATTYNRTLVMSYDNQVIARIKFFIETVEEDERLKIWNANLGYNITPEDTIIFYKSDINEYRPDYMLLNEKRKELMMEGSNIYPYIGSYKAIINAIKFFGYDNLNIIEYWRCVNPDDENFGKIYHSSKYSLTKKETLTIGARTIVLPNKDYKKINALALVYSINKPTGKVDDWELPYVKEQFTYTIEEALIKLFALRKKLNKEFMPGTSRIIDIIGEANYFGIQSITKIHDTYDIRLYESKYHLSCDVYPSKYVHITDNEYFNRYINLVRNNETIDEIPFRNQMLSDIFSHNLSEYSSYNFPDSLSYLSNADFCEYYTDYYRRAFVDHTIYKAINYNDDYPYLQNEEYDYTDNPYDRFSAKVVLTNTTFEDVTFDECELKFDCSYNSIDVDGGWNPVQPAGTYGVTFDNIDVIVRPEIISWELKMSSSDITEDGVDYQVDDELKNVGIIKKYPVKELSDIPQSKYKSNDQEITSYNQFFAELPYVGYYDVIMTLSYRYGAKEPQTKIFPRAVKVEPYQIDVIGFYYDARDLPNKIKYNMDDGDMLNFIKNNIEHMHGWATAERTTPNIAHDMSMPYYSVEGELIGTGPYFNRNVEDESYLADKLTYEMGLLKPLVKYTRYIRSGVDVKPYTWFLLGYEYSKIAGKVNPHWTIVNNITKDKQEFDGKYLTLLLKKEGEYTVYLKLEDKNGNIYEITRNIIVVNKSANYKLYQTFKKDYDYMVEQNLLRELKELGEPDYDNS